MRVAQVVWACLAAGAAAGGFSVSKTPSATKMQSAKEEAAALAESKTVRAARVAAVPKTREERLAILQGKISKQKMLLGGDTKDAVDEYAQLYTEAAKAGNQRGAMNYKALAQAASVEAAKKNAKDAEEANWRAKRAAKAAAKAPAAKKTPLTKLAPAAAGAAVKLAPKKGAKAAAAPAAVAPTSRDDDTALATGVKSGLAALVVTITITAVTSVVRTFIASRSSPKAPAPAFKAAEPTAAYNSTAANATAANATAANATAANATAAAEPAADAAPAEAAAGAPAADAVPAAADAAPAATATPVAASAAPAAPPVSAAAPLAADAVAEEVPGMSNEAAARLAQMRLREELVGRLEGRYALLGKTMPFGVRNRPISELRKLLKQLRAEVSEAKLAKRKP